MFGIEEPSFVYADLPRTGLGYMMLVWAAAAVFAHLNGLPLLVSRWDRLRLGPLLRGERSKRFYRGYFARSRPVGRLREQYVLRTYERVREPRIEVLGPGAPPRRLYVFNEIAHWSDPFGKIRDHRDFVRGALAATVAEEQRRQLARQRPPVVGVHVRMGDFRALRPGEDFTKVGHARTPLDYFVDVIRAVRELHGRDLPVTLFSDGRDHELRDLLALPSVTRAPPVSDLVEMLLLGKSRLIVCSAGSSFSSWAAYLSDAPALVHAAHHHALIRPRSVAESLYEGPLRGPDGEIPALLVKNVREIHYP